MNKLIKLTVIMLITIASFSSPSCFAYTFHVQITAPPTNPNKSVRGRITSADFNDQTPNYCYGKDDCSWRAYIISKSKFPEGYEHYGTLDKDNAEERIEIAKNAKTMGELAIALRDAGLLSMVLSDFLPVERGIDPTLCIFAAKGQYLVVGHQGSNCADAPPPPTNCKLTPESILFDWGTLSRSKSGYHELKQTVQISCTEKSTVRLQISGSSIPLTEDSTMRAEFDLGDGWTGSTERKVDKETNIEITSRLMGLGSATGSLSGSSILILEVL